MADAALPSLRRARAAPGRARGRTSAGRAADRRARPRLRASSRSRRRSSSRRRCRSATPCVERLAREGHPWMNLRVETVRTLALGLVGAGPRARGTAPAFARPGARPRRAGLRRIPDARVLLRRAPRPARVPPRAAAHVRGAPRRRHLARRPCRPGRSRIRRKRQELRGVLAALRRRRSRRAGFIDSAAVLRRAAVEAAGAGAPRRPLYLLPRGRGPDRRRARARSSRLAGGRLETLATEPPARWTAAASRARLVPRRSAKRTRSARSFDGSSRTASRSTRSRSSTPIPAPTPRSRGSSRASTGCPCTFAVGRRGALHADPGRRLWPFSTGSAAASRPTSCGRPSPRER